MLLQVKDLPVKGKAIQLWELIRSLKINISESTTPRALLFSKDLMRLKSLKSNHTLSASMSTSLSQFTKETFSEELEGQ
jgi:hypothetical protein